MVKLYCIILFTISFAVSCGSDQLSQDELDVEKATLNRSIQLPKDNQPGGDKPVVSNPDSGSDSASGSDTPPSGSNQSGSGSGDSEGGGDNLIDGPTNFSLVSPTSSIANVTEITLAIEGAIENEVYRFYSDSNCTDLIAESTAEADGDTDITIDFSSAGDGLKTIFATKTSTDNASSACSTAFIEYTLDTKVQEINALTLHSPASSPSNVLSPAILVSGQDEGDIVSLYTDSNCLTTSQIGFAAVSSGEAIISLDPGKITSEGLYTFHGKSSDQAGNQSPCSTAMLSYSVDLTAPNNPSAVSLETSSPGMTATPSVRVDGLTPGDTLAIYIDGGCTEKLAESLINSGSETLTIQPLATEGSYSFWANARDAAGNLSSCVGPSSSYLLDMGPPTLSSVSISGPGGSTIIGSGGVVYVDFIASEALSAISVNILNSARSATVTNTSGLNYRASYQFENGDSSENPVIFTIDFEDAANNTGNTVSTVTDNSSVQYDASNFAPVISLGAQTIAENSLLSFDINDSNTGNDTDQGGDSLSYSCYYDSIVDGTVSLGQTCSSLGASFDNTSGVFSWTPSYDDAGAFELRIIADDGNFEGEVITELTVTNTNRAPAFAALAYQELNDGESISHNFNDSATGTDADLDGDIIIWNCVYDDTIDGSVSSVDACSSLPNLNFSATTGQFSWTVAPNNVGSYEIKVSATDGSATIDQISEIDIIVDISLQTQYAMIGNNVTTYISSLGDNNEIKFNGVLQFIKQTGDVFTLTASQGDKLECSTGCFAMTPEEGTAAWATETYASSLISTYMGRRDEAKLVIAAFDHDAYIEVKQYDAALGTSKVLQNGSGTVAAGSTQEFLFDFEIGSLWIESDQDIAAYIVSRDSGDSVYNGDGRIVTAAAKQSLAFVSGGGGTPSGVTTVEDGTTVSVYRNDGTNYFSTSEPTLGGFLDITEVFDVTSQEKQMSALSAVAVYSDKKSSHHPAC